MNFQEIGIDGTAGNCLTDYVKIGIITHIIIPVNLSNQKIIFLLSGHLKQHKNFNVCLNFVVISIFLRDPQPALNSVRDGDSGLRKIELAH